MPEIKSSFLGGKMNKDLDERLLPKGQYRNAENVEISTSETSDVGVVKSVLGNKRLEAIISPDFTCVGTIANEKTNKLYWFVSTYLQDGIFEYDTINDVILPVLLDTNASNSKAVLRFGATSIITGINIIDDLLLWTDNLTEPKKINIEECKKGTSINADGSWNHTQLLFENGSFDGITIGLVTHWSGASDSQIKYFDGSIIHKKGRYAWVPEKHLYAMLGSGAGIRNVKHYRAGEFLGIKDIQAYNGGKFTWVSDPNRYAIVNDHIPEQLVWELGDVIFSENTTIDIEERHVTVIKPKPLKAPTVKINHSFESKSKYNIPNLFETKFPRFSYRYKFRDGEFSTFAPFTNAVFSPKYPKDINNSTTTNVFYSKDNAYSEKDPSNKAMANSIHSIELTDFITANTPQDVIEIDILYKQENSSVIYSIDTIKHIDSEWHTASDHEGLGLNIGVGRHPTLGSGAWYSGGGYTKGKYIVTTENIYAALPANQLLRPWDNVPRRALAQEVTGNRVVYGNYLQNYDLGSYKTKIKVSYNDRINNVGSFDTQGLPSIKSQRNYQLGVVYCDEYGRETPVFTSSDAAVSIPWANTSGLKNASRSLQLSASIATNFPEWVESMKFFIKETSNEYYNLVMSRAWVVAKTYELDNSEGHLWISFPSSDRNKVSEGEYIILKKQVGVGESQVANENKFKIIDIQNEAPDAIKYELVNHGSTAHIDFMASMTTSDSMRMDVAGNDNLYIDAGQWKATHLMKGIPLEDETGIGKEETRLRIKDLYASWRRPNGAASKKYKIISGKLGSNGKYTLKLQSAITKIDADIAHKDGNSSNVLVSDQDFHAGLVFQIEKKELKTGEDFSGSFFVKISKNEITEIIESGGFTSVLDNHQVSAKTSTFFWRDEIALNSSSSVTPRQRVDSSFHGLSNYNGIHTADISTSSTHNIHHAANNSVGTTNPFGNTIQLTDYAAAWEGILEKHGRVFFIDGMHMVAGQSETSDYAKFCCVTWSGAWGANDLGLNPDNYIQGDCAWSYPPLKTWLGDYEVDPELVENVDPDTQLVYENMLVSTSPQMPSSDTNGPWGGNKVDGWVGHSQQVIRDVGNSTSTSTTGETATYYTHVNGLEGLVTSTTDHSENGRRWMSGITGGSTDFGNGVDTKTYSTNKEVGRHFMHLSFFAPGVDLHDDKWEENTFSGSDALYGSQSFSANLQGIWGGGHFTGVDLSDKFGTVDGAKHQHLSFEGNYDDNLDFLPSAPGPGVGFGYDLNYKQRHERQWDPTFPLDSDNKIRDFIRNIHAGAQFKFNPEGTTEYSSMSGTDKTLADETFYTIKSVAIKKLYNHTSWRNTFNRWIDGDAYTGENDFEEYFSVEKSALIWLDTMDDDNGHDTSRDKLKQKIVDFGSSHNRRVCYVIELDKDPSNDANFDPVKSGMTGKMSAAINIGHHNIEFLDKIKLVAGITDLNKFPAIWETDPVKQEVDLDIYYEASNNIPVRLGDKTSELFAPIGCTVEIINGPVSGTSTLIEWNGNVATLQPGFKVWDGANEINYTGVSFKFIKKDGSFTIAKAGANQLVGALEDTPNKVDFVFEDKVGENIRVGLAWNNCFSFGNGLESNRIRDDFNEIYLINGVKASTTTQKTYEEEHRSTGLIYSGLYNSNSGVNDLNQFIMAEKITKDLNPTYGSIQKLFQRRISLIAFCEDKVIGITSNKDAIYNADGNPQLISSNNVLGDANPFEGNFGISKNPESFASENYRAYFTDKNRGAVIRLSKDGLTPISSSGMNDWFRDNLQQYPSLIGTYDSYKEDYNLTLSHGFGENIIFNSRLESGGVLSGTQTGDLANIVKNPSVFSGQSLQYPYEAYDVLTDSTHFPILANNSSLISNVLVTNHAIIPKGHFQPAFDLVDYDAGQDYVDAIDAVTGVDEVYTAYSDASGAPAGGFSASTAAEAIALAVAAGYGDAAEAFLQATYADATSLPNEGEIFTGHFSQMGGMVMGSSNMGYTINMLFGNFSINGTNYYSGSPPFKVSRTFAGGELNELNLFDNPNSGVYNNFWHSGMSSSFSYSGYRTDKIVQHNRYSGGSVIRFDRVYQSGDGFSPSTGAFVEFKEINVGPNSGFVNADNNLMVPYNTATGTFQNSSAMFAGDEIEVRIKLRVWDTSAPLNYASNTFSGGTATNGSDFNDDHTSYNVIQPFIELHDGSSGLLSSSVLQGNTSNTQLFQPYADSINNLFYWQNYIPATFSTPNSPWKTGGTYDWSDIAAFSSGGGGSVNYEGVKFHSAGPATDSRVFFPMTTTVGNGGTEENIITEDYTIVVRFKFRDPGANYDPAQIGYFDPLSPKVVDDLRIRVGQNLPNWQGTDNPTNGYYGYQKRQRWDIRNISVTKLLGITDDSVAYIPEEVVTTELTTTGVDAVAYVPAIEYVAPTLAVAAVVAVPPEEVEAWTQVTHLGFQDWTKNGDSAGQCFVSARLNTPTTFGSPWFASAQQGVAQNNDPSISGGGDLIDYVIPGTPPSAGSPFEEGGYSPYQPGGIYDGDAESVSDSGGTVAHNNTFFHVNQPDTGLTYGESVSLSQTLPNGWVDDNWYLIDIEFQGDPQTGTGYNPNTGAGGADGYVLIEGVANKSGGSGGVITGEISSDGVGEYAGQIGFMHCRLIPTIRTEYGNDALGQAQGPGDGETVLRAIFQFDNNSWSANSNHPTRRDTIKLKFIDFQNAGRITKIISKKLEYRTNTGTAVDWSSNADTQVHSFNKKEVYWSSSGSAGTSKTLCFEQGIGGTSPGGATHWEQSFATGDGPIDSLTGWKFKFTVTDNPRTGSFQGIVNAFVNTELIYTSDDLSGNPESRGLFITNIDTPGDYEIDFNFAPQKAGWTIVKPSGSDASVSVFPNPGNSSQAGKIFFSCASGVQTICGIKNFVLGDKTFVLAGGTVESWDWQGFDETQNNYITWDDITDVQTGSQAERIAFNNCPAIDPSSTGPSEFITASQYIDIPVRRYEQYTVSFDNDISSGTIQLYYFNVDGFGFRIGGINSNDQGTVSTNVTIGEDLWSTLNPVNPDFVAELRGSFAIRPNSNSANVNGWIDNITMTRNYALQTDDNGDAVFGQKTVSFSERVNGWSSFKSFAPENGTSLSKKYYTFDNGGLYQHYTPMAYEFLDGTYKWVDSNPDAAENYNIFYGVDGVSSSIKTILNDKPDIVKTFNTLNYEGSQSQVKVPSNPLRVTIDNVAAWNSGSNIDGWKCTEIKTNLEAGSVNEFVNKEGKWFGYIKGVTHTAKLDTSRFSVQGIGVPSLISATPIMVPVGTFGF